MMRTWEYDTKLKRLGLDPRKELVDAPHHLPQRIETLWITVNAGTDRETDECLYIAIWPEGWKEYATLPERFRGMQTVTGIASAINRAVYGQEKGAA